MTTQKIVEIVRASWTSLSKPHALQIVKTDDHKPLCHVLLEFVVEARASYSRAFKDLEIFMLV